MVIERAVQPLDRAGVADLPGHRCPVGANKVDLGLDCTAMRALPGGLESSSEGGCPCVTGPDTGLAVACGSWWAPASPHGGSRPGAGRCRVIHLRVVSPPDVTGTLMPVLHSEPAVMNLTTLPGAINEVIGRLRDLGLEQRGSIVLETSTPRSPRTPTAHGEAGAVPAVHTRLGGG